LVQDIRIWLGEVIEVLAYVRERHQ
jgi:hypothetical protein